MSQEDVSLSAEGSITSTPRENNIEIPLLATPLQTSNNMLPDDEHVQLKFYKFL